MDLAPPHQPHQPYKPSINVRPTALFDGLNCGIQPFYCIEMFCVDEEVPGHDALSYWER